MTGEQPGESSSEDPADIETGDAVMAPAVDDGIRDELERISGLQLDERAAGFDELRGRLTRALDDDLV